MAKILKDSRFWLLLIIALAAFLRLYRLPEYLQFLGDEGRDVLVVKRMIVDHQWTLLGPTASVGGFYIGGLYYYFMLPFLWAFQLNPVGPAVMDVLFGIGLVALTYFFGKIFFNSRAGLIAAFLLAISPKMVDISRFSWNPNPVPFFALLTILLLFLATRTHQKLLVFLSGASVGVMLELHYIDLAFVPIFGLCVLLLFPIRQAIINLIFGGLGIISGNSMFLIFELRHNFPNTRSALEFIFRGGATVAPRSNNLVWLFNDITRQLYEIVLGFRGNFLLLVYYSSLAGFGWWAVKSFKTKIERPKVILLALWLVLGAWGVGSYKGTLLEHYYSYLLPLPFILIGLTLQYFFQKRFLLPIAALIILILSYFEVQHLFLWTPPNNLLAQTQAVDRIVLDLAGDKPFNFALVTSGNSDHAYRYFLEIWGRPPVTILNPELDPKRETVTSQLIAVCEQKNCQLLGHPLWEIAGFGQAQIAQKRDGPAGITIYKLTHYQPSIRQ